MKKTLLIAAMLLSVSNSFAQLVVNSDGRVGIGYNVNPTYMLTVDSHNEAQERRYLGYFNCNHSGLHIEARGEMYGSSEYHKGLDILSACPQTPYVYGIYSRATKSYIQYDNHNSLACGVMGEAADSSDYNIGVLGAKEGSSVGAGIFGIGGNSHSVYKYAGCQNSYAGYFYGNVHVTGSLTGALLTSAVNHPFAGSGTNIDREPVETRVITDESSDRVSDKLQQVQLLQFIREKQPETTIPKTDSEKTSEEEGEEERNDTVVQTRLSTVQYSLAADQLKEVYPELVYEDVNGNVRINYVEMVPLLVQSINELSRKISELEGKGTSTKKAKTKAETTSIEETSSEVDMVRMDQNKPNPFSESTVIKLNIPKDTKSATIFIYDLSGKQVKSIPVTERGKTDITVYASDLTAGMYIYNLVVNGQVKVTRKMIFEQ